MSHVRSSSEVGQHLFLLQALPSRRDMHAKISRYESLLLASLPQRLPPWPNHAPSAKL